MTDACYYWLSYSFDSETLYQLARWHIGVLRAQERAK